jgi:hypothetical protein
MRGRLLSKVAVAAVCVLAGCSEQQQKTVTGPEFVPHPPPSTFDCDFSAVATLVNSYFGSPLQQNAKTLEQQMEAAGSRSDSAVQRGFDIMSLIGQASRQTTSVASTGSNLTKALMRCMFDVSNTTNFRAFPDSFDFAPALTKNTGGAYYVRGGTNDATSTVIGADFLSGSADNLSAVAPAGGSWTSILAGNAGGRALIYGSLIAVGPPLTYDWKLMPPNSSFASPFALVAICDGNVADSAMVNESSAGFLPYAATSICSGDQSVTMLDTGWGPRALLSRAAHWSAQLLTPQSLQAAVVGKTGSGGTTSGFKSKFKTNSVSTVTVTFTAPGSRGPKLGKAFDATVNVTALDDQSVSTGVLNTCVYFKGSNNNGTPTRVQGLKDPSCTTPPAATRDTVSAVTGAGGTATISLTVTKSGGLVLTANAQVIGRSGSGVGLVKTNVAP